VGSEVSLLTNQSEGLFPELSDLPAHAIIAILTFGASVKLM